MGEEAEEIASRTEAVCEVISPQVCIRVTLVFCEEIKFLVCFPVLFFQKMEVCNTSFKSIVNKKIRPIQC